jgi:hypothetical protein
MRNGKKLVGVSLVLFVGMALSGCAGVSNVLDSTGDVLNGDFRLLADAKPATISEIWQDWKQNEVMAKDKWDQKAVVVPGIVERITKTGIVVQTYGNPQNQIAVIFQDPTNSQCTGQAITRDDLMVNQKMVANLKTGDRVKVTGVLGTDASTYSGASGTNCSFTFQKAKIELASAAK